MSEQRRVVFHKAVSTDRMPDWSTGGVAVIEWMQQRGLWHQLGERLKIQREGGYVGIDAFQFLLYFFCSDLGLGLKEFSERARERHVQLAAVGSRRRLPTQSSMSRILSAVETERVRDFGSWLLLEAPGVKDVLQHPSVLTRDALSEGWHIFDWDPTVTTLRHRALPVVEGTPEGRRRSEELAEPGYCGRKRGDVQFSRATLQHAGSGLWLGIEMGPGNGSLRDAFESAVSQVDATCEYAQLPRERAILRSDGAAGNVPFITACVEGKIHYITRLAHYQLLNDEAVVKHLNEAEWFEVPSSGSGPQRQAADLGRVMLEPSMGCQHEDGTSYEPIMTRVVVSRFPVKEQGRGAGVTLDGWQYELYGTDLSAAAWPETEIVAGYYGRSGQENRFCQEDRELGLDRIFSYHLPGQHLATLVGLFVWNFHICRGIDLTQPVMELPEQLSAQNSPVADKPLLGQELEPIMPNSTLEDEDGAEEDALSTTPSSEPNSPDTARRQLIDALDELEWENILHKHQGWQWITSEGALRCPAQALLPFMRIEVVTGRRNRVCFTAPRGVCDQCKLRQSCIPSADPQYRKDMRLRIPSPHDETLREMSRRLADTLRKARAVEATARRHQAEARRSQRRAIWRIKPLSWQPPQLPASRPALAIAPPVLLPAALRKTIRKATRHMVVHVRVVLPRKQTKPSPVMAVSIADRQRRRLSWDERLRWNELPDDTRVEVLLSAPHEMRQLLAPPDRDVGQAA
jgi:hypothetical protein